MQPPKRLSRILVIALTTALILGSVGLLGLEAMAQGDATATPTVPVVEASEATPTTPTPPPALEGEGQQATESAPDATWTVSDISFESNYPQGFTFTADIKSSAGPITAGRVIWSHVPGQQKSRPIEVNPETGTITATWESLGESTPPWVGVNYYFDVGDAQGNRFQTDMNYAEYSDPGHDWLRSESDDIIVFSEGLPSDVNEMVMDAMAQEREKYRTAWGDLLPYKPRAILFGDQSAWAEWRAGPRNPNVVGETKDYWGGTAQVAYSGDLVDLAYGTVPHEIAHLYQAAYTIMTAGSWFIEGDATFFEAHQQYDYLARVRDLAQSGNLPALLQGTGPGVSGQRARQGYDIGYTWWKWLTDTYGLEAHYQLIELLDTGMRRNDAIEQVTGLSIQEVERRWRTWLGASPEAPTLIPTPTLFTFPTPTPFVFGNKK